MTAANELPTWWKEGVCYQVWPQSFSDSNDDGNGDIQGVIARLDYLHDLGVDYIWMSPMYASPRDDYGYDISDYEDVNPMFGTLADMDELIAELHKRGMKLILDLVVNHTSDQHKWFKESAKSRDNEYSDFYTWKDPKIDEKGNKKPPNNWKAFFGGSAWRYVEAREQYCLHMFLESMPDLNWEVEKVRKAIYKSAIEFWLARGVSGFRVDVVNLYSKNLSFPDAPITDPTEEFQNPPQELVCDGPRMHEWLQEQRREVLDKFGQDVVLVGELSVSPIDRIKKYLDPKTRELDMIFDFEIFVAAGPQPDKPFFEWKNTQSLMTLRKALMKPQSFISEHGLWATSFLENHDTSRCIQKYGAKDPAYRTQSGKLLALMSTVMSGTLFIYQGQEIGMVNIPRDWPRSDLRDPAWIRFMDEADAKYPNDAEKHEKLLDVFERCGRDHARTPVQWSGEEPYAGFSTAKPWIRVNESFRNGVNVQDQQKDSDSLLNFWKKAVHFRKENAQALVYGDTEFVDNDNEHVFSVIKHGKTSQGEAAKLLIIMNHSDTKQHIPAAEQLGVKDGLGRLVFATGAESDSDELRPWEGRVFSLA